MIKSMFRRYPMSMILIPIFVICACVYLAKGQDGRILTPSRWCTGVACTDGAGSIFRSWSDGTVEKYISGGMFGKGGWSTLP